MKKYYYAIMVGIAVIIIVLLATVVLFNIRKANVKYGNQTMENTAVEEDKVIEKINNESIKSVAVDEGLSNYGMLSSWISKYKENGYNIVERKRGRTTMIKKPKQINKKETDKEKIERLEKENVKVYRTDQMGEVSITINKNGEIKVKTQIN